MYMNKYLPHPECKVSITFGAERAEPNMTKSGDIFYDETYVPLNMNGTLEIEIGIRHLEKAKPQVTAGKKDMETTLDEQVE